MFCERVKGCIFAGYSTLLFKVLANLFSGVEGFQPFSGPVERNILVYMSLFLFSGFFERGSRIVVKSWLLKRAQDTKHNGDFAFQNPTAHLSKDRPSHHLVAKPGPVELFIQSLEHKKTP